MSNVSDEPAELSATPPAPVRLSHALHRRHVSMIAIGGTIGSGLFVGASGVLADTGSSALVAYLLAGLAVVMISRMLGEMAVQSPATGSFVNHIRRGLGARVAFVAGWSYWLMWVSVLGIEIIVCSSFIAPYVHVPYMVLELIIALAVTGINLASVRGYGEVEYWLSCLKIGIIVVFITICALALGGVFGLHTDFAAASAANRHPFPRGVLAIIAAIPTVIFSMAGTEATTIAAVESDDPAGNVAQATRSVALRILLFYLASVVFLLCVLPWSSYEEGHSPFLTALQHVGVGHAADMMTGVLLIAAFSALNSGLYVTSRVMFELAETGDAPAFFMKLGGNGTPRRSILAAAALAFSIALVGAISPAVVFTFLLGATGTVVLFEYMLIVVAQMALRRAMNERGVVPALPMWGYPVLSWMTLGFLCTVLVVMLLDASTRREILMCCGTLAVVMMGERLSFPRRAHRGIPR